uniref:phage tail fiber protein n=1 Tax=Hafnia alvei TaxID=569 RepID=UPI003CD0D001
MGATKAGYRYPGYNSVDAAWYLRTEYLWCTRTTTVDSNGFIKKASPVIKIFSDGKFETNNESEGAQVTREGVGVYRISNILGPHSDKAWGGIDGGFEIPKDRNGQRLIWLDYEVEADGSILVKTYHRTYPDAPAFARNIKDGYEEGAPIDIPSDQFLSVRVEMPQDSIWNQAQKAAQEAMAQEQIVQE